MADKILVCTDLSPNSKAAIRFAIQLASQNGSALVFYYAVKLMKPTRWSERQYSNYVTEQLQDAQERLMKFVNAEYKLSKTNPGRLQFAVENAIEVDRSISGFADRAKAKYICLTTRGAGGMRKLIGSNASLILTTSPIPVLVVPYNYRRSPVRTIFYSADFNDLGRELKKVKEFAAPLKAGIAVYHYDYLLHVKENLDKLKKAATRYKSRGVVFHFQKQEIENSLAHHLKQDFKKSRASMAVLFTKQNRGWFERVFFASRSASISHVTTIPLLIFRKKK